MLDDQPDLKPGSQLGPYQIERLIGAGGMGQVYLATDTRLGRAVAVKILPRALASDHRQGRRVSVRAQGYVAYVVEVSIDAKMRLSRSNSRPRAGRRWHWNSPAIQEQIRRVLANPTSLEIRGEHHTGPDEGALDTVVLRVGG